MSTGAATDSLGRDEATKLVARLYLAYASRLTGYCRGQLGSAQEAEDAVQTTFVHAFQALQNGVVPECESAWLYTIAKNVCHSLRRSNGIRLLHAVDVELDALRAPESAPAELVEGLSAALATLPERQRKALFLREWLGLSSSEVSARLGMRSSETYALLTRARQSMASALRRRTTVAVNLGPLLVKLRALLFGGAAKTAATATVAVTIAVGGTVAVERAASDRASSGRATPTIPSGTPTPVATSNVPERAGTERQPAPSRPAESSGTRRRGPVSSSPPAPPPATGAAAGGPAATAPGPPPATASAAAEPAPTAESGSTARVSTAKREVRVAVRRIRPPRVVPAAAEKLVPPVEVSVDIAFPPEVTNVVNAVDAAVDDVLQPVTSALPALLPPPPAPPPALPKLP